MPMTITEARCEIKMLWILIGAHRAFINKHLFRPADEEDPLAKDGGGRAVIQQQLEALADGEDRIIELRRAIIAASNKAALTVDGRTMSLADWEFWRREIAPKRLAHGRDMADLFDAVSAAYPRGNGLVFNVTEEYAVDLANEMGQMLCLLDGKLAVANATTFIASDAPA